MIITTTPSIDGKRIIDYKGVISGEVIVGINAFKDLFASVRNIIGGRSKSYEDELVKAVKGLDKVNSVSLLAHDGEVTF